VKKEWVFDVPYVAPSGWKGALRAALRQMRGYTTLEQEANDSQMVRLFGNVRGDEEAFHAGSVQFFPTFFNRLGLEVINPHDRKTGAGARGPILLECVPAGAQGALMLLYVPTGIAVDMQQSAADLVVVAQGIQAMLSTYGFGAKTSSGFGIAADDLVDGEIRIATQTLSLKGKRLSNLAAEVEHWLKTTP
jgi:CRISPR-associated protein Cmr2